MVGSCGRVFDWVFGGWVLVVGCRVGCVVGSGVGCLVWWLGGWVVFSFFIFQFLVFCVLVFTDDDGCVDME